MGLWPLLISVLIIINLELKNVLGEDVTEYDRNVGTILFDKHALLDHCWTDEEIAVLRNRKLFQNLIPKVDKLNIQNDEYIANLLNYFHVCLEHVRNMSEGGVKHLMLKSLADAMGGYLHSYVVPIIKVSFYAGNVKYCNIEKIFNLLDEFKNFLHTNGAGWRKPMEVEMFINVTPLVLSDRDDTACDKLIVNSINRYGDRKEEFFQLYLPFLDDNIKPNSIALPFKARDLWSLFEEESVGILCRYYETCVNCITSRGNNVDILTEFNKDFYKWLLEYVYPRLSDDKWYPAFGEVLRILALLKDSDLTGVPITTSVYSNEIFYSPKSNDEANEGSSFGTSGLIMIAISSAVFVWILVGVTLMCHKYLRKHTDECSPCRSPKLRESTLYKNHQYCQLDRSSSINTQKSVSEKVKNWCKQKFNRCPDDGNQNPEKVHSSPSPAKCSTKASVNSNCSKISYKRRKKKIECSSAPASPDTSPCTYYDNHKFHYSSDMSSTNSDSSYR